MEKYYWNPTREDRVGVCMGIFQHDGVDRKVWCPSLHEHLRKPIEKQTQFDWFTTSKLVNALDSINQQS